MIEVDLYRIDCTKDQVATELHHRNNSRFIDEGTRPVFAGIPYDFNPPLTFSAVHRKNIKYQA
ncbi:hypothetical protein AO265_32015 [Pseudomonas sp. ABAC61]|nr:hypothetical protein AO265_32015 [Pseudomonas sp. ABAC61]